MKKHLRVLLGILGACLVSSALIAGTASARTPAPGYEAYAGCPSPEENSTIQACLNAEVTGGHFQMGSKDVPLTNPIKINGGVTSSGGFAFNSKGGLTPVKQTVPGGIVGLTGLNWLLEILNVEQLKLYAVTELAGTATAPTGDPFTLPIKVHLINSVLGTTCYVGSNANPITLHLTRETTSPPPPNKPITGKQPTIGFNPATGELSETGAVEVDNSFAAPGANGCKLELGLLNIGIDGLVNSVSGLPAKAGTNETIQNTNAVLAPPSRVYP